MADLVVDCSLDSVIDSSGTLCMTVKSDSIDKLEVLLRIKDAEKNSALQVFKHVSTIVSEREKKLEKCDAQITLCKQKLHSLTSSVYREFIFDNRFSMIAGMKQYEVVLKKKIAEFEKNREELQREFEKGKARLQDASEQLTEAMLEKKKIERLHEQRVSRALLTEIQRADEEKSG